MPNNAEEELAALLAEVEVAHVPVDSIYGDRICRGCSIEPKFEMMWPCDTVRLCLMVRRVQAQAAANPIKPVTL